MQNHKEYNSMTETQHLLSTKSNRRRLAESIQQVEKGELKPYSFDEFETATWQHVYSTCFYIPLHAETLLSVCGVH